MWCNSREPIVFCIKLFSKRVLPLLIGRDKL